MWSPSGKNNAQMLQGKLFATEADDRNVTRVPGLSLTHDYIDAEEERALLAHVDRGPWQTDWRRRIQQYGLGYSDTGGKPSWLRDFPEWLMPLAGRVARDAHFERFPENCVINEYVPPLGIGPHRDYPAFGRIIACVSLGSDIILDFLRADRSERLPVFVPARSLWVIKGDARSKWLHAIAPRMSDLIGGERRKRGRRVSITFRTAQDPTMVRA
jgi:alkylated DNA repair dioxygenase AlkB